MNGRSHWWLVSRSSRSIGDTRPPAYIIGRDTWLIRGVGAPARVASRAPKALTDSAGPVGDVPGPAPGPLVRARDRQGAGHVEQVRPGVREVGVPREHHPLAGQHARHKPLAEVGLIAGAGSEVVRAAQLGHPDAPRFGWAA